MADTDFSKNVLDYGKSIDFTTMTEYLNEFCARYPFMKITPLGDSILGRSIPLITLGEGSKSVLYVGAHHGMEWITTALLLRFINEFCEYKKENSRIYSYSLNYLFSTRKIYIVPMLNPDGVDYQINGVGEDNVLYSRLLKMNNESKDFTYWQANARGVDLNHNYDCGFQEYKKIEKEKRIHEGAPTNYSGTMPESEPEVFSLCNFIRFEKSIKSVITLHTQGEEIYCTSGNNTLKRSNTMAGIISRMTGYKLGKPKGTAAYGGLTDWCISKMNIPSFTVECGKGENPLPMSDYFKIYTDIREMLFMMPTLI